MKPYEYSARRTSPAGSTAKPRWRGRCSCGRSTEQTYSTKAVALTAIRRTHNKNIQGEEHDD